ncbi:MAG: ATPase domain-containing protein [Candidatus Thermoplasmatota archaeon]
MEDRLPTYVKGLDERMEGGVPKGHLVLVCGRAGTMKSTLCFHILFNSAKRRKTRGIYLTLEQSRVSLLSQMIRLGMDPRTLAESGIIVIDMTRLRKESAGTATAGDINWNDSIVTTVQSYRNKFGCDIFVLDSLAALYSLSTFKNPRNDVYFLFERLRELGMTTYLISEMLEANKQVFGIYGVEDFLADGIFHLDLERDGRRVNLFLSTVKMRKTNHERNYFPLIFDPSTGFEIVTD